ncbi:ERF family protein [Flavobacterium sp. SUN046]|uniref:ERF family protein n=1 Tax=Flavobacterium sp. SUN046 TaxID=3002440 RepID=UPI002DBB1B04|nr:ERF family protein [Flavobacterium sp. SUN046]MEC4049309.1 ERF family protein [Flavobacterium sp. SUN046]
MSKTNIFKALANFQQEVSVIHKDTQGYGYTYADLPKVFEIINPLLKKHGLGFSQLMQGQSIQTILFHIESGETLESLTDIPQNVSLKGMNEYQVLGSAITYLRRYSISSILGLVTDKDTDASGEQQKSKAPASSSSKEAELPWLNVTDKDKNFTREWSRLIAKKQAKEPIDIKELRKFYRVSKEVEAKINELINQ